MNWASTDMQADKIELSHRYLSARLLATWNERFVSFSFWEP